MPGRDRFLDVIGGYRSFTFLGDSAASQVYTVFQNVRLTVYKLQANGSREGSVAIIYSSRNGAAKSNPFITPAGGAVDFFADPGEYEIDVLDLNNPVRFTTYIINWSAVPGGVDGMSAVQLPGAGGGLSVAGDIKIAALVAVGQADPAGWLWCDGRVISRTTYANLFAVIGTAFNVGGETTAQFKLPDLRGRVPMGPNSFATAAGSSGRVANGAAAIGNGGGEDDIALTVAQMPSHQHVASGTYTTAAGSDASGSGIPPHNSVPSGNLFGGSTSLAGGGEAHNNMQPYQCVGFLIKI
jgi:microcystin-dependent protein